MFAFAFGRVSSDGGFKRAAWRLHAPKWLSSKTPRAEMMTYLSSKGYNGPTADKMLDTLIETKAQSILKQLNNAALGDLAKAVNRELEVIAAQEQLPDVHIHILPHGAKEPMTLTVKEGQSLYEIQQANFTKISHLIECACGGIAACSTCHVILDEEHFRLLPEVEEAELDMLDLTEGVTPFSRLGCQIVITKQIEGLVLKLPASVQSLW